MSILDTTKHVTVPDGSDTREPAPVHPPATRDPDGLCRYFCRVCGNSVLETTLERRAVYTRCRKPGSCRTQEGESVFRWHVPKESWPGDFGLPIRDTSD